MSMTRTWKIYRRKGRQPTLSIREFMTLPYTFQLRKWVSTFFFERISWNKQKRRDRDTQVVGGQSFSYYLGSTKFSKYACFVKSRWLPDLLDIQWRIVAYFFVRIFSIVAFAIIAVVAITQFIYLVRRRKESRHKVTQAPIILVFEVIIASIGSRFHGIFFYLPARSIYSMIDPFGRLGIHELMRSRVIRNSQLFCWKSFLWIHECAHHFYFFLTTAFLVSLCIPLSQLGRITAVSSNLIVEPKYKLLPRVSLYVCIAGNFILVVGQVIF